MGPDKREGVMEEATDRKVDIENDEEHVTVLFSFSSCLKPAELITLTAAFQEQTAGS